MKYVSIDIETTGLDSESCSILEIGAIIEDTKEFKMYDDCPKFRCLIRQETYTGEPFALAMNEWIFTEIFQEITRLNTPNEKGMLSGIGNPEFKLLWPGQVAAEFKKFLSENNITEPFTPAGKNFSSFDRVFLQKLPKFKESVKMRHRALDPSCLFIDWENDDCIPGMESCKQRAGFSEQVTHKALDDAWDVIMLFRYYLVKKLN